MKISVIIPTYNEEKEIISCLASLEKQNFSDFEVIVVDDGSTDTTLNLLSDFETKSFNLSVLKQNHKGPGAARNMAVEKASGEILVFLDADMTFDKNFLRKLIQPIIAGKAKGTFSKEEYVSNWDNVWSRCWNINEGWEQKRRHPKNYPDNQKVFRAILKSEFKKVGGFTPGGYNDDWSLSAKLGYEAVSAPHALFYHANPSNLSEVFKQAKWVGKRPYKLGALGIIFALLRSSLPISLLIGFVKFVISGNGSFVIFKVVYDFGIILGIFNYVFKKTGAK
jgi:glycosyltransferase involved in cell wall biosynthesis